MNLTNARSQRLMPSACLAGTMAVLAGVPGSGQQDGVLDSLKAGLTPKYGQQTDYGIPLNLRNTPQSVDR